MTRAMPFLFVAIWATGFLTARLVASHVDPLSFLGWRFVLSALVFTGIAVAVRAPWPRDAMAWRNALVAGVLMQGIYLSSVFWAVNHGVPAGIAALITGLQPLLTAMLAFPLLGERVTLRRWAGIMLGFAGALLVLHPQLRAAGGLLLTPLLACGVGMVGITLGTIWQKRHGGTADLRTGAATQFIGAAIIGVPLALLTEQGRFDGSWQAFAGLGWAVLGLSVGATTLLLLLIRRGAVAGVASLFYLVPPVVALAAFALFGEHLSVLQVTGMGVATAGVAIASRD